MFPCYVDYVLQCIVYMSLHDVNFYINIIYVVAQWRSGKSFRLSIKRTPVRILCCRVKPWANLFTLHCSSALSCMDKYLPIGSGGYEKSSRIICSLAECFPETPRWCSVEGRKNLSALNNPADWILRYKKTYRYKQPIVAHTFIYNGLPSGVTNLPRVSILMRTCAVKIIAIRFQVQASSHQYGS